MFLSLFWCLTKFICFIFKILYIKYISFLIHKIFLKNTFKYETFAEVERACERYYYKDTKLDHKLADGQIACNVDNGAYALPVGGNHPTAMRAAPTLTLSGFTYSGCAFNSSNTNGNGWGMRVTVDNTSQFRITAGTAELNAEL